MEQDQTLLLQSQGSQQGDRVAWRGATREPASGDSSLQEALTATGGTFTKDFGVISKDDERRHPDENDKMNSR